MQEIWSVRLALAVLDIRSSTPCISSEDHMGDYTDGTQNDGDLNCCLALFASYESDR